MSIVRHYVDTAIAGVQISQQGAAADAAVGAMTPLGAWVDEARRLAIDTSNTIGDQISAFTTAKGSIPEIPPEPRGWGWRDLPVIDAFTTSDQEVDEAFSREQEWQARAAMTAYQDSMNTRLASLTQFARRWCDTGISHHARRACRCSACRAESDCSGSRRHHRPAE